MTTYEPAGAPARELESSQDEDFKNASSDGTQVKEEWTEKEIKMLVENDRKIRADNNATLRRGLIAASDLREKHYGRADLSYIVKK